MGEVKNLRGDRTPSPTAGWRPLWIMAAAKLFLLSCLVAVVGYFTYKELQVRAIGLVKEIHIPAKQSDVFQKLFDDPEFYLKIHPLWYVYLSTLFFTIARYLSISFEYLCPVVFISHGAGASLTEEQNFSDPNLKCVATC